MEASLLVSKIIELCLSLVIVHNFAEDIMKLLVGQ